MKKLLLMLALVASTASAQTKLLNPKIDSLFPDRPVNYLTDVAGVIKNPEQIDALLKQIREKDSLNIAVVILPTIKDRDVADVAIEIGRKWKVAQAGDVLGTFTRNTGGVILLAIKEHKVRIEVATGSEGYLTDSKAGDLIRLATPAFKSGDFAAGVTTMIVGFDQYHRTALTQVAAPVNATTPSSGIPIQVWIVLSLLISAGIVWLLNWKYRDTKRKEEELAEAQRVQTRQWAEEARQDRIRYQENRNPRKTKPTHSTPAYVPVPVVVEEPIRPSYTNDPSPSYSSSSDSSSSPSPSFDFGGSSSFDGGGASGSW